MQFDPKKNGPIQAHTRLTDFSPWGKKSFCKISLNLELKKGKNILKVMPADFFYICPCL